MSDKEQEKIALAELAEDEQLKRASRALATPPMEESSALAVGELIGEGFALDRSGDIKQIPEWVQAKSKELLDPTMHEAPPKWARELAVKRRIDRKYGSERQAALALGLIEAADPLGAFDIYASVSSDEMREEIKYLKDVHPGIVYGTEIAGMALGGAAVKTTGKLITKLIGKEAAEKVMRSMLGKSVKKAAKAATVQDAVIKKLSKGVGEKLGAKRKLINKTILPAQSKGKLADAMLYSPAIRKVTKIVGELPETATQSAIYAAGEAAKSAALNSDEDLTAENATDVLWNTGVGIGLQGALGLVSPLAMQGGQSVVEMGKLGKKLVRKMHDSNPETLSGKNLKKLLDIAADGRDFTKRLTRSHAGKPGSDELFKLLRDGKLMRAANMRVHNSPDARPVMPSLKKETIKSRLETLNKYFHEKRKDITDIVDNSRQAKMARRSASASGVNAGSPSPTLRMPGSSLVRMNSVADALNEAKLQFMTPVAKRRAQQLQKEIHESITKLDDPSISHAERTRLTERLEALRHGEGALNDMLSRIDDESVFLRETKEQVKALDDLIFSTRQHGDALSINDAIKQRRSDFLNSHQDFNNPYALRSRLITNEILSSLDRTAKGMVRSGDLSASRASKLVQDFIDNDRKWHLIIPMLQDVGKAVDKAVDKDSLVKINLSDAFLAPYSLRWAGMRVAARSLGSFVDRTNALKSAMLFGEDYSKAALNFVIDKATQSTRLAEELADSIATRRAFAIKAAAPIDAKQFTGESEEQVKQFRKSADQIAEDYQKYYQDVSAALSVPEETMQQVVENLDAVANLSETQAQKIALQNLKEMQYIRDNVLTKTTDFNGDALPSQEEIDNLKKAIAVINNDGASIYARIADGTLDSYSAKVFRDLYPKKHNELVEIILPVVAEMGKKKENIPYKIRRSLETLMPGYNFSILPQAPLTLGVQQNAFSPDDRTAKMGQDQLDMGARAATEF
tara:strand:+ start:413 stop:3322 length:2910 start_codon:yes stop_codon:yes gene_type:complete